MLFDNLNKKMLELDYEVRIARPNISFPENIDYSTLPDIEIYPITPTEPPSFKRATHRLLQDEPEIVGREAFQRWKLEELKDYERVAVMSEMVKEFEAALDTYMDSIAWEKRYDNRMSCALRAGYPCPFQAEGMAFATWMDACNATAYSLLNEVINGQREIPNSPRELIDLLPKMVWPS